jgi:membrane fusion protein
MRNSFPKPADGAVPLFRAEALRHQAESVFGSALDAGPVSFCTTTLAVSVAAIALIAIVVFGSYAQRETVDGFIASTDGDIRVFPQAAGVVTNLRVSEGMHVSAGESLFSLLTSRNGAMSTEANVEIRDAILAEQQALRQQAREQEQYFATENTRLQRSVQNSESIILALRRQLTLAGQKSELVRRDRNRLEKLGNAGFLAERERDALSVLALESEIAVETIVLRLAEQEAGLQDTRSRIDQLGFQQRTRLAEIAVQSGQIAQRLAVIGAGLMQVVSSPVDGRISALHVLDGQSVGSETLVMNIIPQGSRVYAELLVPGRSVGMLDPGQAVDLRFDAYPFEKFGIQQATVEQVARSLLLPDDARFPVAVHEPVYRVRARLHRQSIDVEGDARSLSPGLTFQADILLGERTLLEWLLAPVIGASKRL